MTKHILDIPAPSKFPSERPACTYCQDSSHSIQRCEVYSSHHDMGSHTDAEWIKGREEVLARRKALAFGGIMEMYLKNPSAIQVKKVRDYRLEQERKLKESMADILAKLRGKK